MVGYSFLLLREWMGVVRSEVSFGESAGEWVGVARVILYHHNFFSISLNEIITFHNF